MAPTPLTSDQVRELIIEELSKRDAYLREQARESAIAAATESGTIEKVVNNPVLKSSVREGAATYVKNGSYFAAMIAVAVALPVILPYCSAQQALSQAKTTAQEVQQSAEKSRAASVASAAAADASSSAAVKSKETADAAVAAAQRALDRALQDAPAATRAFVDAINTQPTAVQEATTLLGGVQSFIKVNKPDQGALQVGDTLVCWGEQAVVPVSAKSPDRRFKFAFAHQFEGDPVVVCSVMNDGGDQGFAVTDRNLGEKEFNGVVTETRASAPLTKKQTVTVSYVAMGKAKLSPKVSSPPSTAPSKPH
ncbi:MAG: hypothetical protein QM783_01395 [Phycisphaerales bacterium]